MFTIKSEFSISFFKILILFKSIILILISLYLSEINLAFVGVLLTIVKSLTLFLYNASVTALDEPPAPKIIHFFFEMFLNNEFGMHFSKPSQSVLKPLILLFSILNQFAAPILSTDSS